MNKSHLELELKKYKTLYKIEKEHRKKISKMLDDFLKHFKFTSLTQKKRLNKKEGV